MKKTDLRIIKTKKAIKEAFITLVEEKGYEHVKIKDITERAVINRNTFYLHYISKENLVSGIVADEIQNQMPLLAELAKDLEENQFRHFNEFMDNVLRVFYEKIEFYRILLTNQFLSGYITGFEKELREKVIETLKLDRKYDKVAVVYSFAGFFGVISDWIINDTSSLKETSEVLTKMCINSIKLAKKI